MDFYEVVDRVVQLLQQRGRLTYQSLKVQFKLDDETFEALKDELLFSHPAVDQDGRGVVWTGASEAKPEPVSASPSTQTSQPPPAEGEPSPQVAPLSTEQRIPEAERRQLTVMFCDLVDSTRLSSQLDPEDYREVVREYHKVCSKVITRFDGHIAQLLGDGLLIYFGYPHAHEDDAQRAVHTGLSILAAMGELNSRLQQEKGIQLGVRLGIHTGLVVIGEMGGAGRQEQLALGETPNIAARIQGLAQPNTLVISDATSRLVHGYFACQELGEQTLRGVAEPLHVYRVLQESGARGRLDVAQPRGLTPLVGRESEVALLLERWEQAKSGHGQVVLLTGDAGIGKSRLVQVLKDHIGNEPHVRWECRSAEYAQNTALFPHTDLFQRLLQFHPEETLDEKVGKLEQMLSQHRLPLAESVPLFAPLLSLPIPEDTYPPLQLSPQRQRQKTLETMVAILLEHAERQPVLFILEDLHWTDPTTLEFLDLLVEQVPTAAISTLLTCRPYFQPAWHHRSYLTEITVNRLSRQQVERMAQHVAGGKNLPSEVLQQLVERTDGVPLFVEEMTKTVLESGVLKETNEHYDLAGSFTTLVIPSTLQDSLMARLDRLMTAKVIAQLGAVIGRQFSYVLLHAVSQFDEATLQRELGRLVEAELVYQRGLPPQATYLFKHALVVDAAYQSLLKSTRQQYHQQIAQVLEERFPETAETQPELLAHHYTEAGLIEQAVVYWHKAGERAIQRSANAEAIIHLKTGLGLLNMLPDTPERTQQELNVQIALGPALMATKGWAASEVGHVYTRARQLCQQEGNNSRLFPVLAGLRRFYLVGGEVQAGHDLSESLLALAQQNLDQEQLLEAHYSLGFTLYNQGLFATAREHFDQGVAFYDAYQHDSPSCTQGIASGEYCLGYSAYVLWFLGYPDQSIIKSHEALSFVQKHLNSLSLAFSRSWAAKIHLLRREVLATQEQAEAAIALSTEQGFAYWLALGMSYRGWALAMQGQKEEGIAQIRQGLAAFRATGAELAQPFGLALLAEAYGNERQLEDGLTILAEALAKVDKTGERWCEAELHRLKGELLLQQSLYNQSEAETCFHKALKVSQNQQAKSWELRAAISLAKLWQRQGKRQDAYGLLAPVYHWFTEGLDTADLQDAKALLNELGA